MLTRYKKIIAITGTVLLFCLLLGIFFVIRPVQIIRFQEAETEFTVTFIKSPFLKNEDLQILIDHKSLSVNKRFLVFYQLIIPKKYDIVGTSTSEVRFMHKVSHRLFTRYVISNTESGPSVSEEAITEQAKQFKNLVKQQYPYFDLFPYITINLRAQYDKPSYLTIYLRDMSSDMQQRALINVDSYLQQHGASLQVLYDDGVQIEFKALPINSSTSIFVE